MIKKFTREEVAKRKLEAISITLQDQEHIGPCPLCGESCHAKSTPVLSLGGEPICLRCARKHAPKMAGLLRCCAVGVSKLSFRSAVTNQGNWMDCLAEYGSESGGLTEEEPRELKKAQDARRT